MAGKATDKKTTKTVVFQGYEFTVPASWPVYRLDEHPRTCVRYDVHAVYLGAPGANMQCPAGLVGRTQAVSFIPGNGAATGAGAGSASRPEGAGGTEIRKLSAVKSAITQDAAHQQLQVALGAGGLGATLMGTYGTDPAAIQRVLSTLRVAPAGATDTPQSANAPSLPGSSLPGSSRSAAAEQRASLTAATSRQAPSQKAPAEEEAPTANPSATYSNWHGVPTGWPVEIIQPSPKPTPPPPPPIVHPVDGFDTCSAPSLSTMQAWKSQYSAVGVYIGGVNSACAYGNLSASWIRSAASMGWGMLPTYVGPQAPCWGLGGVTIDVARAVAEGKATALDAISDAKFFKLPAGSPVYYDMEAYGAGTSCRNAVLAFLGAWDRQMNAAGYVTGVYSSNASGIRDMQAAAVAKTAGFTPPQALWFALWDSNPTLSDGTLAWPPADRNKQYHGPVNQTIGGVTLNIDKDYVGGPVAR